MIDHCKATEAFRRRSVRDDLLRFIAQMPTNTAGPERDRKPVFVVGARELAYRPFEWWQDYIGGNAEVVRATPLTERLRKPAAPAAERHA